MGQKEEDMKLLKSSIITAALAAVSAVPAFAHVGPHEAPLLASVMHWITSPTHAGLAIIASLVVLLALNLKQKS